MDLIRQLTEPFTYDFMLTSLGAAIILALLCATLGTLLIPRGLSMFGDGLAHATLGGVGVGLVTGFSIDEAMWFAMPFAMAVAAGIVALSRHSNIANDAALGVFFAVSLALGIAALHVAAGQGGGRDIESILFGNILGVQLQELILMVGLGAVVGFILWIQAAKIAYSGFYGELAALSGIRILLQEYLLMVLTAVVTVMAVRAVGVMLVSAWLIIPALIGKQLTSGFGRILIIAGISSILGSVGGLVTSYYYDIPSGAAMTLSLGFLFVLSLMMSFGKRPSNF